MIQRPGRSLCGEPRKSLTRGYAAKSVFWKNDEATVSAIDRAGWMRAADVATVDVQGYAQVIGRLKDMVICGGENLYRARSRSSSTASARSATFRRLTYLTYTSEKK